MANHYIFLFPVKEFFLGCEKSCHSLDFDREVHMLDLLINARYGCGSGYEMNWLLFSSRQDRNKPDIRSVDARMPVLETGRLLVAGTTYAEMRRYIYFDPAYVLSQIPNVRKLVVGGFHDDDCVDRVAAAAHARGLETLVDEDTTEMFFNRRALGIKIPLERNGWSIKDFGMTREQGASEFGILAFKESRRDVPPYRVKV